MSELLTLQVEFARTLGAFLCWIFSRGYQVTLADGAVQNPRLVWEGGEKHLHEDGQHMRGSLHYDRLAQDLNLFVNGVWVTDGGNPIWAELGAQWESMHPLASWGGRFNDSNHFSFTWKGKR